MPDSLFRLRVIEVIISVLSYLRTLYLQRFCLVSSCLKRLLPIVQTYTCTISQISLILYDIKLQFNIATELPLPLLLQYMSCVYIYSIPQHRSILTNAQSYRLPAAKQDDRSVRELPFRLHDRADKRRTLRLAVHLSPERVNRQ